MERETNFFQLGGAESSTDKTSAEESLTSLCCCSFSICVVEPVSAATTITITLFSDWKLKTRKTIVLKQCVMYYCLDRYNKLGYGSFSLSSFINCQKI